MEILKTPRPENAIENIEQITYYAIEKAPLEEEIVEKFTVEKTIRLLTFKNLYEIPVDSIELVPKPKAPLETEFINEFIILGLTKPENEIQIIDQMEILKTPRPENVVENIDEITYYPIEKAPLKTQSLERFIIQGIIKKKLKDVFMTY